MSNFEYEYYESDGVNFLHNLDSVMDHLFWYHAPTKSYRMSSAALDCINEINEDLFTVIQNLDMMLFEGHPLAVWVSKVGVGRLFRESSELKFKLTDRGLAPYAE